MVLVLLERLKNSMDHGPCLTGEVEEQCGPSGSPTLGLRSENSKESVSFPMVL